MILMWELKHGSMKQNSPKWYVMCKEFSNFVHEKEEPQSAEKVNVLGKIKKL
jgi:hypothetical protein